MKKNFLRLASVAILLIAMLSFSACGSSSGSISTNTNTETNNTYNGLVVLSVQDISIGRSGPSVYLATLYDSETFVMYAITFVESTKSSPSEIVPLYNPDGTLKVYTPSSETNNAYNGLTVHSIQDLSIGRSGPSVYLAALYDPEKFVMYSITFVESPRSSPSKLVPLYNADETLKVYTPTNSDE